MHFDFRFFALICVTVLGLLGCDSRLIKDQTVLTQRLSEIPVLGFDEVARVSGKSIHLSLFEDLRIRAPQATRDQILWAAIVAAAWSTDSQGSRLTSHEALALALYSVGGPWSDDSARAAKSIGFADTRPEPKAVAQRLQPIFEKSKWIKNAPLLERL